VCPAQWTHPCLAGLRHPARATSRVKDGAREGATGSPALKVRATATERRDALAGKLFAGAIEALDLLGVYIGDRLGLYRALADRGPLTSPELAEAAGIHERYAREWLEQQAASGILDLELDSDHPAERRFRLPEGHDEALLGGGHAAGPRGAARLP
jgi:hypothetical protein